MRIWHVHNLLNGAASLDVLRGRKAIDGSSDYCQDPTYFLGIFVSVYSLLSSTPRRFRIDAYRRNLQASVIWSVQHKLNASRSHYHGDKAFLSKNRADLRYAELSSWHRLPNAQLIKNPRHTL